MRISQETLDDIWEKKKAIFSVTKRTSELLELFTLVGIIFFGMGFSTLLFDPPPNLGILSVYSVVGVAYLLVAVLARRNLRHKSRRGQGQKVEFERKNLLLRLMLEILSPILMCSTLFLFGISMIRSEFGPLDGWFYVLIAGVSLVIIGYVWWEALRLREVEGDQGKIVFRRPVSVLPFVALAMIAIRVFEDAVIRIQGVEVNAELVFAGAFIIGAAMVILIVATHVVVIDSILIKNGFLEKSTTTD